MPCQLHALQAYIPPLDTFGSDSSSHRFWACPVVAKENFINLVFSQGSNLKYLKMLPEDKKEGKKKKKKKVKHASLTEFIISFQKPLLRFVLFG